MLDGPSGTIQGPYTLLPHSNTALRPLQPYLASSSRRDSVTPLRISFGTSELSADAFGLTLADAAAWFMAAVGGRPTTQGLGLPEVRCRDLRMRKAAASWSWQAMQCAA